MNLAGNTYYIISSVSTTLERHDKIYKKHVFQLKLSIFRVQIHFLHTIDEIIRRLRAQKHSIPLGKKVPKFAHLFL